ncbi:MAG: hypothetical protein JO297_21155 [Nitrososphaeraceae archaeon]|nr:hypothetical protein [Nitrososphaeraceae archaeon]
MESYDNTYPASPPTIEEGFLDFVQKLGGKEIYEAIKDADPVSQIYGYRDWK